jgi:hypothetical protein
VSWIDWIASLKGPITLIVQYPYDRSGRHRGTRVPKGKDGKGEPWSKVKVPVPKLPHVGPPR